MRALVVAVALTFALSGCAANAPGLVGLQRVGEHLRAIVAVCDGRSLDQVRIVEDGGPFHDEWEIDPGRTTVDLGVLADAVTATSTGTNFVMSASSSSSADAATGPTFTADTLAQLNDRAVVMADPKGEYGAIIVTEDDFTDLSGVC